MLSCAYRTLEQLRWELVVQEMQIRGEKVSPEVMESAKKCAEEGGGLLLPKVRLTRPNGMSEQDFDEAKSIFKDVLQSRRQAQIAAVSFIMDLIEHEVEPQLGVVKISATEVLQGGQEE